MKIATIIVRVLLGLIFLVFGLNGFLHFLKMPPPPQPLAGQYLSALALSGYLTAVFALQIVGGLLLLAGFAPLGLVILCPIIVNILLFHGLMAPEGLPLGVICALLALFLVWRYWAHFAGIIRARA